MIAIALMPLMLMAQARIGIVNSQQLFDLMPEKASAEAQLKVLSDRFHTEYLMLQRDFDKKYKGSYLGAAWSILNPLMTLLIMRVVFGHFFGSAIPDSSFPLTGPGAQAVQ